MRKVLILLLILMAGACCPSDHEECTCDEEAQVTEVNEEEKEIVELSDLTELSRIYYSGSGTVTIRGWRIEALYKGSKISRKVSSAPKTADVRLVAAEIIPFERKGFLIHVVAKLKVQFLCNGKYEIKYIEIDKSDLE